MDGNDVRGLAQAAVAAQRAGRAHEAVRLWRALLDRAPEQPVALNALGIDALARRAWDEAAALFRRAIAADPKSPELWMNLAKSAREAGDAAGERAALDGALALDQRHFMALVRMAELEERCGDGAAAMARWSGVLAMAPMIEERTPALDALFEHARDYVTRHQAGFAAALNEGLAEARAAAGDTRRIDACIDHLLGRRAIYANVCSGLHVPFLPADEFFDRALLPWLADLEAHTATIRAECAALMEAGGTAFTPYVEMPPGTPANKWSPLDHRRDWGALHLWRHGRRIDAACALAPRTAEIVARLPLADMPGRTPTVFFSLLQPGTHLPPHTGASNARAIVHLPLIVPPECGFRVGGETREWREGEAWVFDDTIEHEAWNRSREVRAILILDVWNPHLSEAERGLLRRFCEVANEAGHMPKAATGD